ncbi:MAG TPA: tetratricopeptide repeat protein [Pirellulales bacterium]|nr:tetratricopeptide repeat protein [Pirellulales bacterium]
MHFIARGLIAFGALSLCIAIGRGQSPDDGEAADDVVFVSDAPADAVADPSPPGGAAKIEPFEFDGIQPGGSTMAAVRQIWGEPLRTRRDSALTMHEYAREPFEQVEVAIADEKVQSIVVRLRERFSQREVAEQLQVGEFEPVSIFDRTGVCREKVYPERGVALRSLGDAKSGEAPETFQVMEIAFGEIQSQLFLLRAQSRLGRDERGALDDLDYALALEPRDAAALTMKAKILAGAGRIEDAMHAIESALAPSSRNPELRLLRAELLAKVGNHDEAIAETQELLSQTARPAAFRARMLVQLGRLLAEGPTPDFREPIAFYQQAIKLVEPLVDDPQADVRREANETLVEAHLQMAYSIAWGRWKMKEEAVARWLQRADSLADGAVESGDLGADYQLRVCQMALAAHVGAQGLLDPAPWAEQTLETGRVLVGQASDLLCRQRLQWQLGLACHDALQAFEMRQQFDEALRYGKLAVAYLEQGRPGREETSGETLMFGRLYYRLGTLHARRLGEHRAAVTWYERALPLVERAGDAEPSRRGEEWVTAAISYWNVRQRDKALAMTARGIELLEKAVERGDVDKALLAVPYANLAAMHEQLGDRVQAASYSEQAARAKTETAAVK